MYAHQIEQLAEQRQAELGQRSRPGRGITRVRLAHQEARAARTHHRRHPIRRRTGYALITLGLRLAYLAGDD